MMIRTLTIVFAASLALGIFASRADAQRTLEQSIEIAAAVARAWEAFTTDEGFASWAAPKAKVDFRLDGEIRSSYDIRSNLDDEHTIVNRIIAIHPHRMLAIRNVKAPAGFAHAELFQQTWTVIYFHPLADNRTRIDMYGLGYGEGPQWDEVYGHFDRGNAMLLDVLKRNFE